MVKEFINDDEDYLRWVTTHQNGYVLNTYREPRGSYLMLHRARCGSISTPTKSNWTSGDYIKICSSDKMGLEKWAKKRTSGDLHPCELCKP